MKDKNQNKAVNFRPINNSLPTIKKLIEITVKQQFQDHFTSDKLIVEEQIGFRDKHNCESAVQLLIAKWKNAIDKGDTIVVVFILDFSRAFETVDRDILLTKLACYLIRGSVHKIDSSNLILRIKSKM